MKTEIIYHYLRHHDLSANLSEQQVKDLCDATRLKMADKGEPIFFHESEDQKIYFLLKGKIKITEVDEFGNELIKEIINEGDFFGEVSLDGNKPNDEFAQALIDDTVICSFTVPNFQRIMQNNSVLALNYVKKVGTKLRKLENRHSDLVFRDVKSRLISFFKEWASREGQRDGNKIILKNYLTHNDIANLIATSRQSVTVLLNELKESGFLNYNRSQFEINDLMSLN